MHPELAPRLRDGAEGVAFGRGNFGANDLDELDGRLVTTSELRFMLVAGGVDEEVVCKGSGSASVLPH